GLPAGLDLTSFDAIAETLAGNPDGRLVEAAHAHLRATVAQVAALFRTPYDSPPSLGLGDTIGAELAGLIAETAGPIDFSDPATLAALVARVEARTGIPLDPSLVTAASQVIAASNEAIDAVTGTTGLEYLAGIARARTVAQGPVADDLARVAA